MCKNYLLLITLVWCFQTNAQSSDQLVVRLNLKLLNWQVVDDDRVSDGQLSDFLTDVGKSVAVRVGETANMALLNLEMKKMFPHLKTADSISIGRQGNAVYVPPFWATFLVPVPEEYSSERFRKELSDLYPLVVYADPPLEINYNDIPNDSLFGFQTSLYNFNDPSADINIDSAWNIETGERFVKVGVFDTGIDHTHPDLDVLTGFAYFDDIATDSLGQLTSSYGEDWYGHGTSVAGIIGAKRNNGIGVAGIAGGDGSSDTSGVSLLDFNLGGSSAGGDWISMSIIDAARGVGDYYDWSSLTNLPPDHDYHWTTTPGYGISLGNHSYALTVIQEGKDLEFKDLPSDTGTFDPPPFDIPECHLCRESFLFSLQNGVTNVVARGNNKNPNDPYQPLGTYPQAYHDSWVISVGASGTDGNLLVGTVNTDIGEWYFSPHGQNLDLLAPGSRSNIATTRTSYFQDTLGWYSRFNGTSASAPHVTGVAALLMSHYNKPCYSNINLDPADIEYILERSATPIGNVPNEQVGWGRLNAEKALKMIDYPEYQIVHPQQMPIAEQLISLDTVTAYLHTPLNPAGWGPLGVNFLPQLESYYLIERYKYQMAYNFGEYITPTTELLDTWVRHSQTNSVIEVVDTVTVWSGFPLQTSEFIVDEFGVEPMATIVGVTNDSIILLEGYYYHFIGRYDGHNPEFLDITPIIPEDFWYPINPFQEEKRMAYSIYLRDSTLTERYDFPCVGENPLIDSVAQVVEQSSIVDQFKIYPNPASDILHVELPQNQAMRLIVTDAMGKQVINELCQEGKPSMSLDISSLESGLYIIYMKTMKGEVLSKKWIKR